MLFQAQCTWTKVEWVLGHEMDSIRILNQTAENYIFEDCENEPEIIGIRVTSQLWSGSHSTGLGVVQMSNIS